MRFMCIWGIFWGFCLYGFEFVFVPDYEPYVETLFPKGEVKNFEEASLWGKVKYLLNAQGYTVSASNLKDLPEGAKRVRAFIRNEKKGEVKYVLWNVARHVSIERLQQIGPEYLALIVFEPPSVEPLLHTDHYYELFSKVLTWEDARVDGKKFTKYCYPVAYPIGNDGVPFKERKFCCVMAANKTSKFVHEIYSERKKAIQYFDNYPEEFDLYGPEWAKEGFRTYKGMVDDKLGTLKKYKFSICYENTKGLSGYITEKIFDCLQVGTIPVYLGAPNISEEVPENCFIDRRRFASYAELHDYMKAITDEEYNRYVENMRAFLLSEKARKYTVNGFALAIVNGLTGSALTWNDLPK